MGSWTKRRTVEFRSVINLSAEQLFRWHWQPGTMDRLVPPWEPVKVVQPASGPVDGAIAILRLGYGPLSIDWVARHCEIVDGLQFADVQQSGPFAYWHHLHKFEPIDENSCTLIDRIEYELPLSPISDILMGSFVETKLRRMFEYRHEVTTRDTKSYSGLGGRSMKVLVSGSHGLVGSRLVSFLSSQGHQVSKLVRSNPQAQEILWNPSGGEINSASLEGFDAVVHLAGDSIASGRWTDAKKAQIRKSRVEGTTRLCKALASLQKPPEVLVSASATGFYGDRGNEELTENSSSGSGFLAEVCQEWEASTAAAKEKGIRVALLRTGIVLTPKGGALKQMLPPFQIGAGGRIGSGKQWMSWVSLDDEVGIIQHIITHKTIDGPVNAVAPNPVTNEDFTSALGHALKRPTIFPVPGFGIKLLLGEMADELLLSSARVKPQKLEGDGYAFRNRDIGPALQQLLGAA